MSYCHMSAVDAKQGRIVSSEEEVKMLQKAIDMWNKQV